MADPYAEFQKPAAATGADPYAEFQAPAAQPVQQTAAEPQTPGFFKQLLSPYNTAAEEFGEKHPIAGIPVRAAAAAVGTIAQTPPAVYHAFADEPTEEEKARYAADERRFGEAPGTETSGLKRVGLGIHRLTVDPITGAHLGDYASGKVTPQAALGVLPEAIGTGIGTYAVGKVGELGGKVLSEVPTPGEMRASVQPFARKFTGVESELKKTVTKAAEDTAKAEGVHQEATENAAERKALAGKLDQSSMKVREHIGKVEESVAKEANAKFDAVRAKIGNPETDPKPLIEAVSAAEANILQGIPENIKEFRSILGHGGEAPLGLETAFEEVTGETPEGPLPITWDKLQSLKSRIDARLRKGARLNGDLKRALYSVQDTIVNTMGDMAEQHGATDLWTDARKTWRQYKEDFHEPTGPSESGSPVAKALDAVDPAAIRRPFVGSAESTLGNRGAKILRKYPQHGGGEAAATVEEMVGHHKNLRQMGSEKAIKPVKTPVVDATQVARDAIARRASRWGDFNARDIGIIASGGIGELIAGIFGADPKVLAGVATGVGAYEGGKYLASRALNKPSVIEWLSKTPPEEVAALNKIPGADKVKIINAITNQAEGSKVKLSPAAVQLLGPANVARIMGTAAGVSTVHNRKEALELMGR